MCIYLYSTRNIINMKSILTLLVLYAMLQFINCIEINELIIKNKVKFITNNKFLSVTLDTSVVAEHYKHFDMKNEQLLKLVSYLSPGYLRIGGNMADALRFSENSTEMYNFESLPLDGGACAFEESMQNCHTYRNFTMSGNEWKQINEFAIKVGLDILFDLNCLIRNQDGSWNSTNAEELISYSNQLGYNIHWQLGNEPDAFEHVFNYAVNASQLAKDFYKLRTILNGYPRYKKAMLIGPDTTRPRPEHLASAKYLKTFLQSSEHILDGVSFHQYYLNGRKAVLSDFLNPKTFLLLEEQLHLATNIMKDTTFQDTPLWLGETSTAYGGGAPGLSNRFVGSFLWLDKLGMAAAFGLETVVRQSLFKGDYALIDEDYSPSPDWWLSILYKKFVGPEVIDCKVNNSTMVRLYCHCSKYSGMPQITIFGINLRNSTSHINIIGFGNHTKMGESYVLTGPTLTSKNILLNGQQLQLTKQGNLPMFTGKIIDVTKPVKMPPYSLVFWILHAGDVKECILANVFIL